MTTTGVILLVQTTFDLWQSWAYAWTLLFPTAVGLGSWIQGILTEQPRLQEQGRGVMLVGGALFLGFAPLSEGMLNLSGMSSASAVLRYGLPVALIAAGAYLLVHRLGQRPPTA